MIAYDKSERSVVSVCDCGARDVAVSQSGAYAWAAAHLPVCSIEVERAARERAVAAVRAGRHRYR